MRDAFLLLFLAMFVLMAFRRPFLMTLAYLYVDLLQPQRLTYYLLNSVPTSLIFALAALLFYIAFDEKKQVRFGGVQALMALFVVWITLTGFWAVVPDEAWNKWDSAWKAVAFGIFLPLVLHSRQRLEGAIALLVLCVGTLTINGGIKTLLGSGGYGTLSTLVDVEQGLYESSTLATMAVATVPLILYLYRWSPLVGRTRLTALLTAGLIFSALLIPIGTEARTGLICVGVLAFFLFLETRRKLLFAAAAALVALVAWPMLPQSFTGRMSTIETYDSDTSASTRLAVWAWTLDFVGDHPLGGGFRAFKVNRVEVVTTERAPDGSVRETVTVDRARAFHSSYFEVLGEHGWPGLFLYLAMIGTTLAQLVLVERRFRGAEAEDRWMPALAAVLRKTIIIACVGGLFVGIAFQSIFYTLLGTSAALVQVAAARRSERRPVPVFGQPAAANG